MKSEQFNFSSKTSSIRGNREERSANDNTNWDRIAYLVIITGLIIWLLYYLITSYYIVSGQGRVITNQLKVRIPADVSLEQFHVRVGKELQKGDSLFTYKFVGDNTVSGPDVTIRDQKMDKQEDLFSVRKDVALKLQERRSLRDRLAHYQERKNLVEKEVQLNVETVSRLQRVEDDIVDLQADLAMVNQELQLLGQQRNNVQSRARNITVYQKDGTGDIYAGTHLFESPVKGRLTNIFKEPSELAFEEESIAAIQPDGAEVLVKVVFEREVAPNLPLGDELAIRFDNGEVSRGMITDVYAAESNLESISNLTGMDFSDKIVVELEPINEDIRKQWQSYNGMGLTAKRTLF